MTHEVSMKQIKQEPNNPMAIRIQAEARQLLSSRSDRQGRMLDIAATKGRAMEPVGRMAG